MLDYCGIRLKRLSKSGTKKQTNISSQCSESEKKDFYKFTNYQVKKMLLPEAGVYFERKKKAISTRKIPDILKAVSIGRVEKN